MTSHIPTNGMWLVSFHVIKNYGRIPRAWNALRTAFAALLP